ncbi:Sjogren's syndrome/scleroderma autoantigen 1 (Autoantigen p27), putative [Entamoeba histolytica HM-1:IMSS-B]|uniref:Sjogren's syndrome/scleroderma autoantigen 1 (Autoantigen p27) protein n=6 Tax=Entamoeba histolytica TaxID=5759 RepID=C4M0F7_ENTH1|nr:hypothetical protein EHI_006840 [Entamoeba histolytica HM-1:IMSS]EMD47168.1 sjogren's syndrome/scleroderma autoantigen 1 (autoantigen p27) protein, putative [Entamoeba histolytica KU27]EMH73759.1 Sjogren's syndrome/scleroderma autoantigen 1 (Autoantigen p27), putative [Entamoeba histolytica HM-1:IMSS-B]EMS15091.1 Sjogren's syndrome/scleroderma autoantigen 1 (Autoantigen p27) protein [Entamoeba histolytica HM-3:IMSS]ENY62800.1 Sjogren's syndrome/scleroderma autoantigen 1 (Autoantigen p27) pro|eukprot:XP_654462.1 hypothetical protein EHI_006840 [Entamoeba histolytica HM-1:IMSS]
MEGKTKEELKMDMVSEKLGKYLLQGWTMLGSCCINHPTVPLMRERGGKKCICVLCDDKYYVEDGNNLLMYLTKGQDDEVIPEETKLTLNEKIPEEKKEPIHQLKEYTSESDEDDDDEEEIALMMAIEKQKEQQIGRGKKKEGIDSYQRKGESNVSDTTKDVRKTPLKLFTSTNTNNSKDMQICILEHKIDELVKEIEVTSPKNADLISSMSVAIQQLKQAISSL